MSTDLSRLASAGQEVDQIDVRINYDIIRLFSEGLYKSPHKAVEELVSNGYDANATRVHILLPEQPEEDEIAPPPLWVIDDGDGMDAGGFRQLWRIAESSKENADPSTGREPIGQFGIGKLAAYVLAWKLTHLSQVGGKLLLTSMDFRRVTGRQADATDPVPISLREVDETTAKRHLAEIEHRDPAAWKFMFGESDRASTWTAAGLFDFKDLYGKLSVGRLRWVLSTGLPLHTDFGMWLNGERVDSSKENLVEIKKMSLNREFPGIGSVSGTACIYEKQLTGGKSADAGRSHGFFIRVRDRVINLEDELFGLEALNHAAWSRFAMEVNANGLREHLLSSREGVRDSEEIGAFRRCLREIFNACRNAYETWKGNKDDQDEVDIGQLLANGPTAHITDPLLRSVRNTVSAGSESFYIGAPQGLEDKDRSDWLEEFKKEIEHKPFEEPTFERDGPNAPALRYDPTTRRLVVNKDHPFVDKLTNGGKRTAPAKLFASSEVLLEGQLEDHGLDRESVASFLGDRDRVLRLAAGETPPTAREVVRRLGAAKRDPTALERAVGAVFQVLGFEYERKGGSSHGPDGVLSARLGRHNDMFADYTLVYDAKQTDGSAIPAAKVIFGSLEEFRDRAAADYGFFIAGAYQGESDEDSKLNRQLAKQRYSRLTLLKTTHLVRLVWLHYQHGVTLTELRQLFCSARTVRQVDQWMNSLEERLVDQGKVRLNVLLRGLEQEKLDRHAMPNVAVVRAKNPELEPYEPDQLTARLKAMENVLGHRWIEVDKDSYIVRMHQTADQILEEFEREIVYLETEIATAGAETS